MHLKLRHYLILSLSLIFVLPLLAQMPKVSTADNPLWYYIQVEGSGSNREGLTMTVAGDFIAGTEISTSNTSQKDNQLFRFEKSADNNYYIISKSKAKRLDVANNTVVNEPGLGYSDVGVSFIIRQVPGTYYYNMETTRIPSLGDSGTKFVHQANQGTPRAIILTTTSWYYGDNSQYAFVPEEQINLEFSTFDNEVYYSIKSGLPQHADKCVADASSSSEFNLVLQNVDETSKGQQWKLVKTTGGRVDVVNRQTGNIIQTTSAIGEFFNKTLFTQESSESNGWTMTHHRAGQFVISGIEEDGIKRYWTFTTVGETPTQFEDTNLSFSDYTWKFEKINKDLTSVENVETGNTVQVVVKDRRIFVDQYEDFTVRNIQGGLVNKNSQLSQGVYLVTVVGTTVKVLVK